jgi:RNA polymerase sigma factor (TIGR02999 family)
LIAAIEDQFSAAIKVHNLLLTMIFALTVNPGTDRLGAQAQELSVQDTLPTQITHLLHGWRAGDQKALDALLPHVYNELRRRAHLQLRKERPDHTLQTAALVNEVYLRLVGMNSPQWEGRSHFFAIASQLMRQILVDYARRRGAGKRGGSVCRLSLEHASEKGWGKEMDVVALDDALRRLAEIDPRQSQIVEMRFFGGLTLQEISAALAIGSATVQRDWTAARAWLYREIARAARA